MFFTLEEFLISNVVKEICQNFVFFFLTVTMDFDDVWFSTYTVDRPICQPPICQRNPICQHFFGNKKVTNRVRWEFQKIKAKFVSHDDLFLNEFGHGG